MGFISFIIVILLFIGFLTGNITVTIIPKHEYKQIKEASKLPDDIGHIEKTDSGKYTFIPNEFTSQFEDND